MKLKVTHYIIIVTLLASIPIYWISWYYLQIILQQELEALATAVTTAFFICLYMGHAIAKMKRPRSGAVSGKYLLILAILFIGNIIWLFIHPNYLIVGSPALNLLLYWLPFVVLSVSLGMLMTFINMSQDQLQEAKRNSVNSQAELQLLQSQLSPHFLFNTLNNLYGISMTRHEAIPGLLLKLAELLRYSVYEAKEPFVLLKDEIAYINNYIEFEKIRLGERLAINTSLVEFDPAFKIAPMLLIVFIENAFKYARNSTDQNIYVDIELKTWANSILFSVKNSYQLNEQTTIQDKYKGFGLANAKKRLDLLYPNRYDLKIDYKDSLFEIMLQLKAK